MTKVKVSSLKRATIKMVGKTRKKNEGKKLIVSLQGAVKLMNKKNE